jgi:putative protein-disulfide isomerase
MCSWCWGYVPVWEKLQQELAEFVDISYCLGGLAEDNDEVMADDMQMFLRGTWQKISAQLGTEFNFDFWSKCLPRRSTYLACRAMLIAREQNKESTMLLAIQHAYYLQARNPSDESVLCQLAEDVGLNIDCFLERINSEQLHQQLNEEITKSRALPINGFPSLVLTKDNENIVIPIDYKNWKMSFNEVIKNI